MLSFLRKNKKNDQPPILTDIHSHFLPGIDDGAKSWGDTLNLILNFQKKGFTRIITTPHIMRDTYPNNPKIILSKLKELNQKLIENKIVVRVEAAAEYYLDETLYSSILKKEPLLTFGDRYLLFETNFLSEPYILKDFIFQATTQGYKLVLAHPERYGYMNLEKAEDMRNRGVLLQLNSISISGFYSRPIQKMAFELIDKGWVDFLGSDCHNMIQANALEESMNHKYYRKVLELPLLNNML